MTDSGLRLECYRLAGPHMARSASDGVVQSDRKPDDRLTAAKELYEWCSSGPKPEKPTTLTVSKRAFSHILSGHESMNDLLLWESKSERILKWDGMLVREEQ